MCLCFHPVLMPLVIRPTLGGSWQASCDDLDELTLHEVLGHGASGVVLGGTLGTVPVAVKVRGWACDRTGAAMAQESSWLRAYQEEPPEAGCDRPRGQLIIPA